MDHTNSTTTNQPSNYPSDCPAEEFAAFVGIDIAKEKYHACLVNRQGRQHSSNFDNNPKGHAKLLRWASQLAHKQPIHFCMEATGSYGEELELFLDEHDQAVSVVNAHRIHHWALSDSQGNKTDKADAKAIALFCKEKRPPIRPQAGAKIRELKDLVRYLDSLQTDLTRKKNQQAEPSLAEYVRHSLEEEIAGIKERMEQVRKKIRDHIDSDPDLKAKKESLISIPGVSDTTTALVLAELPPVELFSSAREAARYAGLCPSEYKSGSSVHKATRLVKGGNKRLRTALYLPAMTAIRCNAPVRDIYERLRAKGRSKACALGAAMHKLLMIIFGVLKSGEEFDPQHASSHQAKKAASAAA